MAGLSRRFTAGYLLPVPQDNSIVQFSTSS
jgi:hypothetical protein